MTGNTRQTSRRTRLAAGLVVVAVSLVVAAAVAGVGFAGGSITAAQYQYGKTTICHHTHSKKNPWVTIKVSSSAVAAHVRHGDTVGACSTSKLKGKAKKAAEHAKATGKKKGHDSTGSTTTTTTTTTTSTPTKGHDNGGGNGKGHK